MHNVQTKSVAWAQCSTVKESKFVAHLFIWSPADFEGNNNYGINTTSDKCQQISVTTTGMIVLTGRKGMSYEGWVYLPDHNKEWWSSRKTSGHFFVSFVACKTQTGSEDNQHIDRGHIEYRAWVNLCLTVGSSFYYTQPPPSSNSHLLCQKSQQSSALQSRHTCMETPQADTSINLFEQPVREA